MKTIKIIYKISTFSGWLLLPFIIILTFTGYSMISKYYMNLIIEPNLAFKWHSFIIPPTLILIFIHVTANFIKKIKSWRKKR